MAAAAAGAATGAARTAAWQRLTWRPVHCMLGMAALCCRHSPAATLPAFRQTVLQLATLWQPCPPCLPLVGASAGSDEDRWTRAVYRLHATIFQVGRSTDLFSLCVAAAQPRLLRVAGWTTAEMHAAERPTDKGPSGVLDAPHVRCRRATATGASMWTCRSASRSWG